MSLFVLSTITPRSRTVPFNVCLAGFFFLALITTILYPTALARVALYNIFVGLVAIKAVAENFDMDTRALGKALFIFLALSNVYVLMQHFGMDPWQDFNGGEIAGFSGRPWVMGCTAAIVLPYVLRLSPWLALWALPLLWLSHSSSIMAAGFLGILIYYFSGTQLLCAMSGLVPILALYSLYDRTPIDPHRIQVWVSAFKFFHAPLFGHGIGSWISFSFVHKNGADWYQWLWAHNEYLQHAFEQGILGLLLVIGVLGFFFTSAVTKESKAALTVIAVLAAFHPVLHWPKLLLLIITVLAIAAAEWHHNHKGVSNARYRYRNAD